MGNKLKPKFTITSNFNFEGDLKTELESYKKLGTLQEYGENGVVLRKDQNAKPGDIVAIKSKDGYTIYCMVKFVGVFHNGEITANMNYIDFCKN